MLNRAHVLAALCISSVACGGSASNQSAPATATSGTAAGSGQVGSRAPDFAARDIQGKTVRLSDYLGKQAILLDFWSTFCQPCLAEMPHLRRIYEKEKARGFVVMAISMDGPETVAEVPAFARRNNMTFPVVLDEDSYIVSLYNPKRSAPLSVLIDKKGQVVRIHEGYNPGDETLLEQSVAKVLDQDQAAK